MCKGGVGGRGGTPHVCNSSFAENFILKGGGTKSVKWHLMLPLNLCCFLSTSEQSSYVALLADQENLIRASLALENLPYAGAFLEAVPIPALGLFLQPSEFVLSVRVGLVKVPTPTPAPSLTTVKQTLFGSDYINL